MATITGKTGVSTSWQQTLTGLPVSVPVQVLQSWGFQVSTSGTGVDQADLKYTKTLSLAATPTTLDLTALTDVAGNAVNFARVKSVTIRNKDTTDGHTVLCGNAAATQWTGFVSSATATWTVFPSSSNNDGFFVFTAPNTTAAAVSGSSKSLKLDPGANTISVDIEIVGASV